ncbi:MAG: hypothetical protein Kow00109_22230 [Acidobacteriota bacterium]
MLKDRRRFFRWPVDAQCLVIDELGTISGELVNLSFGGARIENPTRLPVEGSDVQLVIHRPDYSASLKAHVFWVAAERRPAAFGVEFYGSFSERSAQLLPLFRRVWGAEASPDPLSAEGRPE